MSILKSYCYIDAPLLPGNYLDPVKIKEMAIQAKIKQHLLTLCVRVDDVVIGCFVNLVFFNIGTVISMLEDELYKNKNRYFLSAERDVIRNFLAKNIENDGIKKPTFISNFPLEAKSIKGIRDLALNPVTQRPATIYSIVIELNDTYKWTRERIADWLDTLDNCPRIV